VSAANKTGPLDGIRVLDFSAMVAGPYCSRTLADLGAEVVKVEPPEGDYMRGREPLRQAPDGTSHSAYFGGLNSGKQSVVIDLKSPEGKHLALDLAAKADVIVENFRPGVMKRLSLDYETVAGRNPRVVYCSISGYGQSGSAATLPAYAPIMHAACGYEMANLGYQAGLERPLKSGVFIADVLSGSLAFGGISAALVRRERTGQGEYIDVALMDTMLGLLVYECQEAQFPAKVQRPLYRPIKARDGFLIVAPISPANFTDMAGVCGHPEWMTDPRFMGIERQRNWDALMDLLDEWAGGRSVDECEKAMLDGGVPCSRYQTVRQAMDSDAVKSRGSFGTVRDGAGDFLSPNPAFKFRNAEAKVQDKVDRLGASTAKVMAAWLGSK
jgi:crotonobetainyl-CoA:carnitine CoA-transferase CaiB-like acyl-CoA transferase